MGFGHHGGDPTHVEVFAARTGLARQTFVHVALDRLLPKAAVGGVDGELLCVGGDLNFFVRELELAQVGVQGEAVHARAHGQHKHCGGAIQGITRGDLLCAGLQEILTDHLTTRIDHRLGRTQDAENRANADVDVDVARTIQRVEHQEVLALGVGLGNGVRAVHFLGRHARQVTAPLIGFDEDVVADDVEFFLCLALHVDAGLLVTVVAQHIAQGAVRDAARDGFTGQRHVQNQGVEVASGVGVSATLFDQKLG